MPKFTGAGPRAATLLITACVKPSVNAEEIPREKSYNGTQGEEELNAMHDVSIGFWTKILENWPAFKAQRTMSI